MKKSKPFETALTGAVILLLFLLSGCADFSLSEEFQKTPDGGGLPFTAGLQISPGAAAVYVGTSITFTASGGTPPYSFRVAEGGGSIDAGTGVYTAPSTDGTARVEVEDAAGGTSRSDITILPVPSGLYLVINPASIVLYIGNSVTFTASGGTPPYSYRVAMGGGTVDTATGEYTAPLTDGTAKVEVEDAAGGTSLADITILPVTSTLTISPAAPAVQVGGTVNFFATGGSAPYTYTVLGGGAGGTIDPMSGVYLAPISAGSDTVRVTDALASVSDSTVTIVAASQLSINPALLTISVGNSYQFSASGGVSPYTYSVASGGGTVVGGNYTAPGTAGTAYVRVTDSVSTTSDAQITIVSGGPLAISPLAPSIGEFGTVTFSGAGGSPPYSFTVLTGSGAIGSLSGIYTASGTVGLAAAAIKLTDSLSAVVTTTVDVIPAAPTNLVAGKNPTSQINLSWQDNSASEDGYKIERKLVVGGAYVFITTPPNHLPPGTMNYIDSGLTPNNLYMYRVYAFKGAVDSYASNESFSYSNK